jgi:small subunit ribosomal protein S7
MPRRKTTSFVRTIGTDIRYNSELLQKLINVIMERGKKNVARSVVYEALELLEKKCGGSREKALQLFNKAFQNIVPVVEVRARRVGGSVYQVPMPVSPQRSRSLALRWLIKSTSARSGKTMGQRLAFELLDAAEGRGGAMKKRTDVHKMADANRAFSHYAW